jgi:hypothetical protein
MDSGMTLYVEKSRQSVEASPRLIVASYAVLYVDEVQNVVYNVIVANITTAINTRLDDLDLELKTLLEIISSVPKHGKTQILYLPLDSGPLKFQTLIITNYLALLWKRKLLQELPFRLITKNHCAKIFFIRQGDIRHNHEAP